ncbi:GNAT family N-acetyltransferase [candidate division KSB1 bacterium]|nr:GNAT family N-acetyltransferase [candidate division KSB1 bacterium]
MKIRLLRESDIEDVLSLWNRQVSFDKLTPELLEEKVWDDADFLNELALVVEHNKQVIAFALAVIRPVQEAVVGYIKMFAVDHRFQRNGIASRLLTELENRMTTLEASAVRIAESTPNYLTPGLDPRYTKALVFIEKYGYQRYDEAWLLEADLAAHNFTTKEQETTLAAEGVTLRRGTSRDEKSLADFLQKFGSFSSYPELKKALNHEQASLFFALNSQGIIALAAHNTNNYNTGWFGPMRILDEYQDTTIYSALLYLCLRDIKDRGHRFAIIPSMQNVSFYLNQCAAEISRVFYRYEKKIGS